jgi:hypothetical protein
METAEQFRKYNEECLSMARIMRDPESAAGWNALARRWAKCAEVEDGKRPPARPPKPQHRRDHLTAQRAR